MEQDLTLKREPLGNGVYIYTSPHHTFGTDAVLLADFAKRKKKDKVLDIGTGCGIIPFIMLRDGFKGEIFGVDISSEATQTAERTKEENGFSNLTLINSDLKELKGKVEFGSFSLITCNPPYKADGAGIQSSDGQIKVARHETACNLNDIIGVCAKLLQTSGRLCMCHRPERLAELFDIMRMHKIEPKKLRLVCQRIGERPWLVLVEGRRSGNTGLVIEPVLYVEENGDFSEEMRKIYGPYKENH